MLYIANQNAVRWRFIDDEAVLIHVESTFYYSLNKTGTLLWRLLMDRGRTFDELIAAVAAHFHRREDEVRTDVQLFLEQMVTEQLVTLTQ